MGFRRGLFALVAASAMLAGCSSTTVEGTARPRVLPVDVATLKTGAYLPQPSAYEPDILSQDDLRAIEARRMLGYLAHPSDIDPEISVAGDLRFFTAADKPFSLGILPEQFRPATVDNNMIAGVYVARINESLRSRKKLIVSVLRFPTDAAAAKSAEDFARIATADPAVHTLAIPGHPEVRASSRDDVTGLAFHNRGPYVVLINAGIPTPDATALTAVLGKTLDRQRTAMEGLTPIPLDDLLDIPADPESIMRRALPRAPDYSDPFDDDTDFGAYSPAAELQFERDPVRVAEAFRTSGVDLVGRRGGVVYRTRDLPAAFALQSVLMSAGRNDEVLDPPPGLPDARCLRLFDDDALRGFDALCTVVHDRYVGLVVSRTPAAARIDLNLYQRAAAQYAILANSG
ncbi:DUF7373 family lipoprotein [Nocardia takedensis]|uniref:DUF7373 family lipoprotein n=1 Tax=Nocardia takedensis TaxID=259390 RepID=UPI0002FA16BE